MSLQALARTPEHQQEKHEILSYESLSIAKITRIAASKCINMVLMADDSIGGQDQCKSLSCAQLTRAAQVCTAFALLQGTAVGGATKAATADSRDRGTSTRIIVNCDPGNCGPVLRLALRAIELRTSNQK